MRYRGRVKVSKVDDEGNKIKSFKIWRKKNPTAIFFDSTPEWAVWKHMKESNINFEYEPQLELFSGLETEEFVKPRKTKKTNVTDRKISVTKQRAISYKPDYYLSDFDTYIEVKGFADEVFKLRWKLFKLKGYKGFIVYSLEEFIKLYKQLQKTIT